MRPSRCDGINRREVLRMGGLTAFGLGLGNFFDIQRADAASLASPLCPRAGVSRQTSASGKATSCILIWLDGGPSHLETFDPKPNAPAEIRGPLTSIATSIPGIHLSECLPETAKRMGDIALIRSMTSPLGEHNFGTHYLQSGFRPTPALEYPSFQSVATSVQATGSELPSNIAIPNSRVGGGKFNGYGFLNPAHGPFSLESDPAKPGFRVQDLDLYQGLTVERLGQRHQFVKQLDQLSGMEAGPSSSIFEQAFRIVTSPDAKSAFDLSEEKQSVRQRYGRRTVGQSCLLARRLVERGVPFVTVNYSGWDTHADMYTRLKEGFSGAQKPVGLIPSLDLAFTALIDDLKSRGLLETTLVVVMGEFGRTPKLNAGGGRDHWPRVFSVAMAGGGIEGGQVIGASDATGESPRDRPITPGDLVATIYQLLGIDPALELRTPDGRPARITSADSSVIRELVG